MLGGESLNLCLYVQCLCIFGDLEKGSIAFISFLKGIYDCKRLRLIVPGTGLRVHSGSL